MKTKNRGFQIIAIERLLITPRQPWRLPAGRQVCRKGTFY